jgi:hypothetical protein
MSIFNSPKFHFENTSTLAILQIYCGYPNYDASLSFPQRQRGGSPFIQHITKSIIVNPTSQQINKAFFSFRGKIKMPVIIMTV